MVWIRRLSVLVLGLLIWFGYSWYDGYSTARDEQSRNMKALALAQIWVASANLRNDPEIFYKFRDSVLQANELTKEDLIDLTSAGDKITANRYVTALRLSDLVDSLTRIEFNTIRTRATDTIVIDSLSDSVSDSL